MQTSLFLARLIGPVMLAVGIGALFERARSTAMAEEFLAAAR